MYPGTCSCFNTLRTRPPPSTLYHLVLRLHEAHGLPGLILYPDKQSLQRVSVSGYARLQFMHPTTISTCGALQIETRRYLWWPAYSDSLRHSPMLRWRPCPLRSRGTWWHSQIPTDEYLPAPSSTTYWCTLLRLGDVIRTYPYSNSIRTGNTLMRAGLVPDPESKVHGSLGTKLGSGDNCSDWMDNGRILDEQGAHNGETEGACNDHAKD